MKANEMESGPRDKGGQALQEFQRRHHDMRGPIAVGRFELQDDLAGRGGAQPFVAQGGTGDIATEAPGPDRDRCRPGRGSRRLLP